MNAAESKLLAAANARSPRQVALGRARRLTYACRDALLRGELAEARRLARESERASAELARLCVEVVADG